jgi:hypothetical protein
MSLSSRYCATTQLRSPMRRQALIRARIDSSPGRRGLLSTRAGRVVVAAVDDASPRGGIRQRRMRRTVVVPPRADLDAFMESLSACT